MTVEGQTEYLVKNAPPELAEKIAELARASGATLLETRKPQLTLERLFVEAAEAHRKTS
jgi:hypothetical protein